MDLGLQGRGCVVTGGSRGIGRATVERLAAEGAQVLAVGRDEAALADVAAGTGAATLACDLTGPGAAERVIAAAEERCGGVDVLVNNAGTSWVATMDELTDADWLSQYALHVLAPMHLTRLAAPRMAQRGWGRVVNVCSSAGKRPSKMNPAYSATKAAQLSLSRSFADLWAGRGVLVNAVTPGATSSDLWVAPGGMADQTAAQAGISREDSLARRGAAVPLGRFSEPGEIADVIVFLSSERASSVVGAAWSADGGAVAVII